MRNLFNTLLVVLSAAAWVGCVRDADQQEAVGRPEITPGLMRFVATTEEEDLTRTSTDADGVHVFWSAHEDINIFYGDSNGNKFTSDNEEPASTAGFNGFLSAFIGTNNIEDASYFWGVYPYQEDSESDGSSVTVTLAGNQTAKKNTYADKMLVTVAKSLGLALNFKHVCSGYKFKVVNPLVTSMTFKGNNGEIVAGKVRVSMNSEGVPIWEPIEGEGLTEVTISAPEGEVLDTDALYYLIILPQTFEHGFTMTFRTRDLKKGDYVRDESVTFTRSIFKKNLSRDATVVYQDIYQAVDLGLSVKWANVNIGAETPEEVGNYYAWGELEPKTNYSWSTYRFANGSNNTLTKYNSDSSLGSVVDNKTVLDAEDDIATVTLGEGWRTPTREDWNEFFQNTTRTSSTLNGQTGQTVTSKADPTAAIFIPSTGHWDGPSLGSKANYFYWSSTRYDTSNQAYRTMMNSGCGPVSRHYGMVVRAVQTIPVASVSLNKTALSLHIDDSETLVATITPAKVTSPTLTWTSSAPSVATVDANGTVTAISTGSATITVQAGGQTATCAMTVDPVAVTSVTLNRSTLTLTKGSTASLTATVAPSNATDKTVTWTSSNTSVATVSSSGAITAVDAGTATITASAGGKSATCTVTVTISTTGVSLNKTSTTLTSIGATEQLTATVTPSNATNKNVTWSSSNTSVATVSSSGLVTAVAVGTATITVTTADGSKTATCSVTVRIPVTGVSLNKTSTTLISIGATEQLTATVTPSNATNKNVTWSSSNTSVAAVSSSGLVTAVAAGTATITVTTADGNKTATCTVTVRIPVTGVSLNMTSTTLTSIGATEQLTATVTPSNATNKNVTWTSSNTNVATVSSSGLVTAVAVGSATITVKTNDGNKTATCTVTVRIPVTGVSLNKTSTTLTSIGATEQLTATVTPSNATNKNVTWTSSNTSVATVSSNGLVTAIASGTATITVKTNDGNKTATCTVTVRIPVTGVSLNKTSTTLTSIGATVQLTATVSPSNATNKNVTWTSSNTGVATVDANGKVTAVANGSATVTVKTVDGNKTATCSITVTTSSTVPNGAVDMGLSVYWGTMNLGASSPRDKGGDYSSYKNSSGEDYATSSKGTRWRTPTKAEWQELLDNCDQTWEDEDEGHGLYLTSRITGMSLYLPTYTTNDDYDQVGFYWTSTYGYYYVNWYDERVFYASLVHDDNTYKIRPVATK